MVSRIMRNAAASILMLGLFFGLAWLCGFTVDGVLWDHWPDNNDHPTNYWAQQQ